MDTPKIGVKATMARSAKTTPNKNMKEYAKNLSVG
jgi:hypothetical protein